MGRKASAEVGGDLNSAMLAQGAAAHDTSGVSSAQASQVPSLAPYAPPGPNYSSLLDPNVMMMSNAAATIAAVAASAVQQLANQSASTHATPGISQIPPALLAALRNSTGSHAASSNPSLNAQIAALLGGVGQPSRPLMGNNASSLPPHLQQALLAALAGGETKAAPPLPPVSVPQAAPIPSSTMIPSMQNWSMEQLEQHVGLLKQLNQPVPQSVALLLADARRKEKKRTAKRAANRKSASTSRARKKALVEEMTKTNARLKRQAMILALLPDLVIAITRKGKITFCSAQAERVLLHDCNDMIGAQLDSLLTPSTRKVLEGLIEKLVAASEQDLQASGDDNVQGAVASEVKQSAAPAQDRCPAGATHEEGEAEGKSVEIRKLDASKHTGSGTAVVSERSFPLSVVEVGSKQAIQTANVAANAASNDNSDASADRNSNGKEQTSSLTNSTTLSRSPIASLSGEDEAGRGGSSRDSGKSNSKSQGKRNHSGDDSSSLSSDAKNMRKANDNLDRNVRWHNQRMLVDGKSPEAFGPKDDVTGASVTANNATARLSSLKHVPDLSRKPKDTKSSRYENPEDQSSSDDALLTGVEEKKKSGNASDDSSGYRESNDSREEESSSGSDTSNANDPTKKRLAPTCRLCLVRKDLTTVWCEVTSSIRTRSSGEDCDEMQDIANSSSSTGSVTSEEVIAAPEEKELLLCLRPIRDGKKADASLRFALPTVSSESAMVSSSSNGELKSDQEAGSFSNSATNSSSQEDHSPQKPPKKRLRDENTTDPVENKHAKTGEADSELSVVESLMVMNKSA